MTKTAAHRTWATTLAAFATLLSAGSATAAEAPSRAPVVQAVLDCHRIDDAAQRLACYDKAVDGMAKAEAAGDLVTVDREQRRAMRREAFGFSLPSLSMFDRGGKTDENDRLSAKVATASRNATGKWVFKLDNGAVWVQADDADLYPTPHAGSTVVIRRASLGSYFMTVDGHAIRAFRQN